MNGKDIFKGLEYIGSDLIEEAETGKFTTTRPGKHRLLLIAAIVAMMLMLVGCAVVYLLKMEDVKIGVATEERQYRLVDGTYVEDPHEVSQSVLTLAGLKGSSAYQACAEFYEYQEGLIIDENYNANLNAKAEELAQQYGLNPEGERLDFRTTRNLCNALGMERFIRESGEVSVDVAAGECFAGGNFNLYLNLTIPEGQGYEVRSSSAQVFWNRKDCFSRGYVVLTDSGDWTERNYTTANGTEVLILQSPTQEYGYIFCDRREALLGVQLGVNREIFVSDNSVEVQHMTDRQIELVADALDFAITPKVPTQKDVENQAPISQSASQNGYTLELTKVETDGYVLVCELDITAPQGVVLPEDNDLVFGIYELNPEGRAKVIDSTALETVDDEDGLANTARLKMTCSVDMQDGTMPFPEGSQWRLHLVDVVHSWWDKEAVSGMSETLAEGEWSFSIPITENITDDRTLEFVKEPMPLTGSIAMLVETGEDVTEKFNVTSFGLRKYSSQIASDADKPVDFYSYDHSQTLVVLQDGTQIELFDDINPEAVDLDQVAYLNCPTAPA